MGLILFFYFSVSSAFHHESYEGHEGEGDEGGQRTERIWCIQRGCGDWGLKPKDVKAAVEGLLGVAADQLKKNGSFKVGGVLNLKLKKKPATPARKCVNPFTKEPCVFKAKPASKTVRVLPMKKFKEMVN